MRVATSLAVLLALGSTASFAAQDANVLYNPPPIQVPEGLTTRQVAKVIQMAMAARNWYVDSQAIAEDGGPSQIQATLKVRVHSVTIRFDFDAREVRISYVDSQHMEYEVHKRKGPLIHPNYNRWVQNLEKTIRVELLKLMPT